MQERNSGSWPPSNIQRGICEDEGPSLHGMYNVLEVACCTGARHGHEGKAGVKDGKDGVEGDQVA